MTRPNVPDAVTVVVPTRNRREQLARALRSVFDQGDIEVRVVVVDEASTDDTPAFLDGLRDERIDVVRHEVPVGPAEARNAGLGKVATEWVAFCDDDDLWAPDKLAAQFAALEAMPEARWCCVGEMQFGEAGRLVLDRRPPAGGDVFAALLAKNVVPGGGSGVLVETELLRRVGGFRTLAAAEDWDTWIRLAREAPLASVDRPLVAYHVALGSQSHNVDRMAQSQQVIRETYAAEMTALGVEHDEVEHTTYLARQLARGGHRFAAARRHVALALRGQRVLRELGLALAVLVSPRHVEAAREQRTTAAIDPAWRAEVESWLPARLSA